MTTAKKKVGMILLFSLVEMSDHHGHFLAPRTDLSLVLRRTPNNYILTLELLIARNQLRVCVWEHVIREIFLHYCVLIGSE